MKLGIKTKAKTRTSGSFDTVGPGRAKPARPKPKVRPKTSTKPKRPAAPRPPAAATTPPVDPMDAQVAAASQLQFGPSDQVLAGQQAQHAQASANVPAWYQDYRNALSAATDRTQQAYGAALGVQQNTMQSVGALDAQQITALKGDMAADAATRGATVDPNIAARAQQSAASRQGTLAAQQGLTAQVGAAQVGYRAGQQVVGAAQEVGARTQQRNIGLNLDAKARDLATQKGAFAVNTKGKLQDAARQTELENKAFGLKEEAQKDSDSNTKAALKLKASDNAKTRSLRARELAAREALDAANVSNDAARIRVAQGNLAVARRRAKAYAAGQKTAASGGLTVAEQRSRNQRETKVKEEYGAAKRMLSTKVGRKVRDPKKLRIFLDLEYPKMPQAARDALVEEITTGKSGKARRGYEDLLKQIREGKL